MALWKVVVLKATFAVALCLAMFGTIMLMFVSVLSNGSSIGADEFSWTFLIMSLGVVVSQGLLILAGCKASWRWIDSVNEQAYVDRA